jgi:predicted AlkP superfamily phosphohydrolase/phosphomutase
MRLPIDWEHTQAYLMPLFEFVGGIVVSLPLHTTAYEETRQSLIIALQELVDPGTGLHPVEEVYRREELYTGPYVDRAPDLVFVLDSCYVNDRSLLAQRYFSRMATASRHWTGVHRPEGVFLIAGQPIRPGEYASSFRIEDLAPTILYLLGLPVPTEMDGRVLDEVLWPEYLATFPVHYERRGGKSRASREETCSPKDEAEIIERLRLLGYLE